MIDNKKVIVLAGNKEQIQNILTEINGYLTPLDVEFDSQFNTQDSSKVINNAYLEKPLVTETQSREKIEANKREEEARKRFDEYNKRRATYSRSSSVVRFNSLGNGYYYGYCTWYAKTKRPDLPNQLGNGGAWFNNAQRAGLATGEEPKEGAVIVTRESGWGHVGIVESVNGNKVTISEMNFSGWGKVNNRTLDINDPIVKGFVY